MSENHLPDDPRDWPSDPYALLGVTPWSDESEIRRAYTRLIRKFKPEHHPEQFRRIREAYEQCLARNPRSPSGPDAPSEPAPSPTDAGASVPSHKQDEATGLWALAVDGQTADAYAGLVRLARAHPDRPEVPLRLYWLLGSFPSLDTDRTRHSWLAEALARSLLCGPAVELYRRELEADPPVALSSPYDQLLELPAAAGQLATVGNWRIAAAGRDQAWHSAESDVAVLARRVALDNPPGWLEVLATALVWASWHRPEPLYTRCRDELDRLAHLELRHADVFDRLEVVFRMARGWRRTSQTLPSELTVLFPHFWSGSLTRSVVGPVVATIAADPAGSMAWIDRVTRGRGREALALLLRVLEPYYESRNRSGHPRVYPPTVIRGLLRTLPPNSFARYDRARAHLLPLLIARAIDPLELARACTTDPDHRVRSLENGLRMDLSLQFVWLAARLDQDDG